jgi:hypothetical protein
MTLSRTTFLFSMFPATIEFYGLGNPDIQYSLVCSIRSAGASRLSLASTK